MKVREDPDQQATVATERPRRLAMLRHHDGTYIGVGMDGYPRRGCTRANAGRWPTRAVALAWSAHWGGKFEAEEA